jgi:parvulin-like peptidyl-prolyl isomerase
MRARRIAGLTVLALVAGIGSGELIYRSKICRDTIGRCFGRGQLLALINGRGIYEVDANAEATADRYLAGSKINASPDDAILKRLISNENLHQVSDRAAISQMEVQHELDSLRDQFADEKLWTKRMADSGISVQSLGKLVRENLIGRRLIEKEIANLLAANDDFVRRYYVQHSADFAQPVRLRASHIFLAAPPETLPEIVEAKQKLIESLAVRLRGGEEFEALVWEVSEDEASKPRGGDLGYFSRWRVRQDFFDTVSRLKIGETSKSFRSVLGFHIVRVTEFKPTRQMTFEEARFEIAARLTNQLRRKAVEAFTASLAGSSALRRDWFWN